MMQELGTPTIETERFVMRKLVRDDAEALFATLSDPKQCEFMLRAAFTTVEELGDWLCDPEWTGRSWSAFDKASGEFVARIVAAPKEDGTAELGYVTALHRQGEGIAVECAHRLLEHLFEVDRQHRVIAGTDPRNIPSNRILEKLGFRREAHFLQSVRTHIGWCDEYYWGMLADEWRERNCTRYDGIDSDTRSVTGSYSTATPAPRSS